MLQPINNARTLSGPEFQDLHIWLSGPQRKVSRPGFQAFNEVSGPGSQNLAFRPSTRGFRTWLSGPGFQAFGIWLSGPGSQDLESSPSYGHLIFFPSLFSASTVTFLFPVTFLYVHRHFSLRPPSLFSTFTVTFLCVQWSQTDRRTD